MKISNLLVIGGDERMVHAANILAVQFAAEFRVSAILLEKAEEKLSKVVNRTKTGLFSEYDIVLLPLPVTKDGVNLHAPLSSKSISLKKLSALLSKDAVILGGKIPKNLFEKNSTDEEHVGRIIDYADSDSFAVSNAVPSAEGALQILLQHTVRTVYNSEILLTGYERLGKVLLKTLAALGAKVTVAVRKQSDRQVALPGGVNVLNLESLELENLGNFDSFINTVPAPLFGREIAEKLKSDCITIDLASVPAFDFITSPYTEVSGRRFFWELSLPGRLFPKTAGECIAAYVRQFATQGADFIAQ